MSKVMFVFAAVALLVGLTAGAPATKAAPGGPPCQECLDYLDDCLDDATSNSDEAQCFVEFRACRLAC